MLRLLATGFMFCFLAVGCTSVNGDSSEMGEVSSDPMQTPTNDTMESPTDAAVTEVPTASLTETPTITAPEDEYLDPIDLSALVEAWNSGDVQAIRAFYTDNAVYLSDQDIAALEQDEAVSVAVMEDGFITRVGEYAGLQMRLISEPIRVTDRLAMFAYRWEGETEGTNGVALLRFVDDKILFHVFASDPAPSPNPTDDAVVFEALDLDALMQAWDQADQDALQRFYVEDATVLSDEDLRDLLRSSVPPTSLLAQARGRARWGMTTYGQPVRLGSLALFAWHWENYGYPVGYGVRMLRYSEDAIVTDIRFALKGWETDSASFMGP